MVDAVKINTDALTNDAGGPEEVLRARGAIGLTEGALGAGFGVPSTDLSEAYEWADDTQSDVYAQECEPEACRRAISDPEAYYGGLGGSWAAAGQPDQTGVELKGSDADGKVEAGGAAPLPSVDSDGPSWFTVLNAEGQVVLRLLGHVAGEAPKFMGKGIGDENTDGDKTVYDKTKTTKNDNGEECEYGGPGPAAEGLATPRATVHHAGHAAAPAQTDRAGTLSPDGGGATTRVGSAAVDPYGAGPKVAGDDRHMVPRWLQLE